MEQGTGQPRSSVEVERGITRCAARLRELRAAQAAAPNRARPRFTRDIDATASRLDRLFEEKRASRVTAPAHRRRRSQPIGSQEDGLVSRRGDRAAVADRVFGDFGGELVEQSNYKVSSVTTRRATSSR